MSARFNIALTFGVLAVMLLTTSVIIYFTKDTKDNAEVTQIQSEANNKEIQETKKMLSDFIDRWDKRVEISNKVNNGTQAKIVNGVNEIIGIVKQEFGNLTQHRLVTNATFEKIEKILNQTAGLTGPQYDKLADQKVKDIVGNVSQLLKQPSTEKIGKGHGK